MRGSHDNHMVRTGDGWKITSLTQHISCSKATTPSTSPHPKADRDTLPAVRGSGAQHLIGGSAAAWAPLGGGVASLLSSPSSARSCSSC